MTEAMIISLIMTYSQMFGVDPQLSLAVAQTESNLNPNAISNSSDYGIFQLNRKSFPKLSIKELLNPYVNIPTGIFYLKRMKETCVHKANNGFLVCWNYGIANAKRVKYPQLFPFVTKVNKRIKMNRIDFSNKVRYAY